MRNKKNNVLSKIVSGTAITVPEIEKQIIDNYNNRQSKSNENSTKKTK